MASIYDLAAGYEMTDEMGLPMSVQGGQPVAMAQPAPAAAPSAAPGMPAGDRNQALMAMLGKYFPQGDDYSADLKAARATMTKESEAFNKLLQDAIKAPKESGPSKAEMYFRLAAAFGAPTKTGHFMESLGTAGSAASKMLEERRASEKETRDRRLQLGLEAQKLRMTGAKEDLTTLRQLASEGMKDKRTIATELIKEYVKSGQPESSAGKQAKDEGLVPGTPQFQKRVGEIADMNVERQMAQINAALANIGNAQANQLLQKQKFDFQQEQSTKLSPTEIKLKEETETVLGSINDAMGSLNRAYSLNPKTFEGTFVDITRQKMLEQTNPKDPRVLATREQKNLLSKSAISNLRAAFGGNPTEGERNALLDLEGLDSKSKEERAQIMKNTYKLLKDRRDRQQKRLNEISSGAFRASQPASGGIE
jgi:hypothetical protein